MLNFLKFSIKNVEFSEILAKNWILRKKPAFLLKNSSRIKQNPEKQEKIPKL
jgi:hypothetical protein